jgi:uncharacterized phosphosugar-binding protein
MITARMSTLIDNLGFPPLAGVCSYEDAARPGLSVDETVLRLKRSNHVLRRLHEIATAHLPHTPEWEVKCALSLHLWVDAEHATQIRARVSEMREPPLHLDDVPSESLEAACAEAIRAEGTGELLTAVYGVLRPALLEALKRHESELNPLLDHPTRRMLRTVIREQEEILEWGKRALAVVESGPEAEQAAAFAGHVRAYLAAAGGIAGDADGSGEPLPPARSNGDRYEMDVRPQRDSRFRDVLNNAGRVGERVHDETVPPAERALALIYKRLLEMDVPEFMAPILYRTEGREWEFYADISRQLWDEARHAMIGEAGVVALGVPFYRYPIDQKVCRTLNTQFTPLEAHLVLWKIEQGLMPRATGKRFEWELAVASGNGFSIAMQDYDWADEVLHAQIGRRHLERELGSAAERNAAAEEVWRRYQAIVGQWAVDHAGDAEWWDDFVRDAGSRSPLAASGAPTLVASPPSAWEQYLRAVFELVERLRTDEAAAIEQAAAWVAECVGAGGVVHAFGSGHSHLLAEELYCRAGGLVPVNAVLDPNLGFSSIVDSSLLERTEGYAQALFASLDVRSGDLMLVASVSGINPVGIEMSELARGRGCRVVGLTSARAYAGDASRHSSGRRLADVSDLVVDLHVPRGDAVHPLDGDDDVAVGAASTLLGAAAVNAIVVEAATLLARTGTPPPIFRSMNVAGGDEANARLVERYRSRLPNLKV